MGSSACLGELFGDTAATVTHASINAPSKLMVHHLDMKEVLSLGLLLFFLARSELKMAM